MMGIVHFDLLPVSASLAGAITSSHPLSRNFDVPELERNYDSLVTQLSKMNLECNT